MNEPTFVLPEKAYYSPSEIAERWGCSVADVQHYLEQGLLRPAIKPADLAETIKLVDLESVVDSAEENRDQACDPAIFPFLYAVQGSVTSSLDEEDVLPEMLDTDDFTEAFAFTVTTVQDFDGFQYQLVSAKDPDRKVRFDISELISCVRRAGKFAWDWHPERAIISREERDRFERNHGIRSAGGIVPVPGYTTDYMDIMHQAIAEFFEPRHPLDPTKETVTAWIAGRMADAGLDPSGKLCGAMFTIIKPHDHRRKKEGG